MEKRKSKFKFLSFIRFFIQIISFILLPALYINAFAGIHQIYLAIIQSNFDIGTLWTQVIETIAIIPATILLGRFFCGWMCAFGTLEDIIYLFSSKTFKTKFKINEETDRVLKYLKYVILSFLVIAVWTLGVNIFSSSNPWDVFGFIFTVGKTPAISYAATALTSGFIILALIIAASFFIERFFCRYLCPLGAIFSIISKLRIAKIKKPGAQCGKCRVCTQNCAMGIPLYKEDAISSGECINCFKCVTACPRQNVSVAVDEKDLRPIVAGVVAAAVISGTYYTGSIAASSSAISPSYSVSTSTDVNTNDSSTAAATSDIITSVAAEQNSSQLYNDGTYQGSGIGFRGGTTTVSVTVKNDTITDVQVLSYEDDAPFFNRASSTVIEQILSSQSSDVNAVSGATYSSNGIMSAVSDALSTASVS